MQMAKDSIYRWVYTKGLLVLALLWLATTTHSAFSQEITLLTPIVPLKDSFRDAVPVAAGTPLKGVAIILEGKPVSTRLTVRLPATDKSTLCIALASRDGRYAGRAEYAIGGTPPGVYGLLLRSEHYSKQLVSYVQEDLAVLAWLPPQRSCETTEMRHSLMLTHKSLPLIVLSPTWGATPPEGPVTVLSNPQTANGVRLLYESSDFVDSESQSTVTETDCFLSSAADALAYSTTCTLEAQDRQAYDVQILRFRHERHLPALYFRLQGP